MATMAPSFGQSFHVIQRAPDVSRSRAVLPFPLSKFAVTVLPLIVLGYIFGMLIAAALNGWAINPLLVLLNGAGILLAIRRCGEML